jgi:hypothetical protein
MCHSHSQRCRSSGGIAAESNYFDHPRDDPDHWTEAPRLDILHVVRNGGLDLIA